MREYDDFFKKLEGDKSPNTIRSYKIALDKFFEYFKIKNIENIRNITAKQCNDYQLDLKKLGSKASSVNAYIRPLKAFYNWLIDMSAIENNPFSKIKELNEGTKVIFYLEDDESERMIKSCKNKQDELIVLFFLYEGLRREELCKLKISDFYVQYRDYAYEDFLEKHSDENDIENYTKNRIPYLTEEILFIIKGKGDKERELPVNPKRVAVPLANFIKDNNLRKDDYLFLSPYNKPFNPGSMWYKIKAIGKRAKIDEERLKKLTPHKMRHTFASDFYKNSRDLLAVQKALGHADSETTKIYAHLKDKSFYDAMRKMR